MDISQHELENRNMWVKNYEYEKDYEYEENSPKSSEKKTYEIPVQSNIFTYILFLSIS